MAPTWHHLLAYLLGMVAGVLLHILWIAIKEDASSDEPGSGTDGFDSLEFYTRKKRKRLGGE